MAFLSRKLILLATLLHGQFKHHTQISLYPNTPTHQARHLDANGIKQGSDSKMTDKHSAEHSNTACLGVDWPVCDVYIAHTTI